MPSFISSYSCFAAHFFPKDCPGPLQKHFLHIFWANASHVYSHITFEDQCMPMRPLDAQITGLASPLLQVLLPASTIELLEFASSTRLFFSDAIFPSRFLLPRVAKVKSFSSTSRPFYVHEQGQESRTLLDRCCCHLLNLSVGAIPTASTLHFLAGTMPARNNFLTTTFILFLSEGFNFFQARISLCTSFVSLFLSLPNS